MIRTIPTNAALLLVAVVAATVMTPAIVRADQTAGQKIYTTSLTQTGILASPGVIQGTMRLTVSPNGIANGWYTPYDTGQIVPITGGMSNGKLWLSIGDGGQLRVSADTRPDGSPVRTGL